MLVPFRPLYHISQTPNLTCMDGHLSVFIPLLYPYCIAVMAGPNEPADTAAYPIAALTASLQLLLPNQPATTLKHPCLNGLHLINMIASNYFKSLWRASSIFRQYWMDLMTKVYTWSIY